MNRVIINIEMIRYTFNSKVISIYLISRFHELCDHEYWYYKI